MNQIKRLPFELQAILFRVPPLPHSLLIPTYSSSHSRQNTTISNPSKLISRNISTSSPTSNLIELESSILTPSTIIDLFEPLSDLYTQIPLSSLDYPQAPRSPEGSLYHLLKINKFDEATLLLREIRTTSQVVTPRTLFLKQCYWLLCTKPITSSEWLEWWDVSPSVRSLSGRRLTARRVVPLEKMVDKILQRALVNSSGDYESVRTIAARAAGRGFYRLVARRILLHLVVHASTELSEQVWKGCLDSYKQRGFIENGAEGRIASLRFKMRSPAGYARWRAKVDFRVLKDTRGQMIRMHAAMGRLDLAVELLESTVRPDPSTILRVDLGKLTYVDLLNRTAHSNRLDLFSRVYMALRDTKSRTHRRIRLRGRLLRGKPKSMNSEQTTLQAFDYFRISPATRLTTSNKSPLAVFGISNLSKEFDLAIRQAIESKDLVRATEWLSECMQSNNLPSIDTAANFIALAEINDNTSFYRTILSLLNDRKSRRKPRMKAYWATALMLTHFRSENYRESLNLFASVFDLSGLPTEFRVVLERRSRKERFPKGSLGHIGVYPDAHTFSLATQSLITLSPSLAETLYPSLTNGSFNIRPRTLPFPLKDGEVLSSTPLDPYTFIPFLQAFSKEGRPSIELLKILYDMRSLGLTASKHHWGVVLGSFARNGEIDHLVYLLRLLENQLVVEDSSTAISGESIVQIPSTSSSNSTRSKSSTSIVLEPEQLQVSPEILAITSRLFLPKLGLPKNSKSKSHLSSSSSIQSRQELLLDPAIYTNVIVGLGRKGELIAAGKIRDGFFKKGGRGLVDERMRKVLGTLRRREMMDKGDGRTE